MKFRDFHSFLTKWNIPLETYVITDELLESELSIHESRDVEGNLLAMSIVINGDPPKGSWFIRFDGAHGIVWDGQIVPVYDETGATNTMFELLTQSVGDLRVAYALEKAEKDLGGDLESLKRFQDYVATEVEERELALLEEIADDTSDSTVEDSTEEGTTEGETEGEAGDGTAEGETGSETGDGSEVSTDTGSEDGTADTDGSTLEEPEAGDSTGDGLPDDGTTGTSTDVGSDTTSEDGSTTDDSNTSAGGATTDSSEIGGDSSTPDGDDGADTSADSSSGDSGSDSVPTGS